MKNCLIIFSFLLSFHISEAQIKVACVGNSITNGTNIMGGNMQQYPNILDSLMGDQWEVKNFGHSGATLLKKGNYPYWKRPEYQAALDYQPDIVIIKLGTNDSKPFNWEPYKTEFALDYIDLINKFQELKSKPTIYLALPAPVGKNGFQIRRDVTNIEIHSLIIQIARICEVGLIDFYSLLENKMDLIPDAVHPNVQGKILMAQEVARILKGKQAASKN